MDKKIWMIGLWVLMLGGVKAHAQTRIKWPQLAEVEYSYVQQEGQTYWYGTPTFPEDLKALEGKEVVITGYILPLNEISNLYALSAFPFSSCFFCGAAGLESVMELHLRKKKKKFAMDAEVTMVGTLRLNDVEMELSYILEDARLLD
ncbi:DUF3299 domain-containing protein [Pontibacter sp. G13]|uniref:DUF3299 domain-containing protein n=1 Tax=Pontibacter sp. G13 TaxID=3074898 RepID=UPI00288A665A|nr:DUF3299 domain-containing protein [Pontibacter sp. G13]WNJ19222.1 DUF3299 domain-containing protein [Pontibacter sp. G13]